MVKMDPCGLKFYILMLQSDQPAEEKCSSFGLVYTFSFNYLYVRVNKFSIQYYTLQEVQDSLGLKISLEISQL